MHMLLNDMLQKQKRNSINAEETGKMLKRLEEKRDGVTVVLDDDPTGIQTVHDVCVYMDWKMRTLEKALKQGKMFFIHTNTRAFCGEKAEKINREIMRNLLAASKRTLKDFTVISRGDSTLRGHYPLETQVLREEYEKGTGRKIDAEIIVPFFLEGGRYTIDDVHYVLEKDELLPAGQTEFAKDSIFGYKNSDLKKYIEEKTKGAVKSGEVRSVTLDMLRKYKIDEIAEMLLAAEGFSKIIVNCTSYEELKVFIAALFGAEAEGKKFIFGTAASFVKAYRLIEDRPLLGIKDFGSLNKHKSNKVLVAAGSHVNKTRQQLLSLLGCENVCPVRIDVRKLFAGGNLRDEEIAGKAKDADKALAGGKCPVIYLSSALEGAFEPAGQNATEKLNASSSVSESLIGIIAQMDERPDCVIAKGGVTSSDIATKGLNIKVANVLGQVLPGIPVIMTDKESKWPFMPYVIFPGNVGEKDSLKKIYELLHNP